MNRRMQELCAWCGPAAIVLFLIGYWFMAGLVPPPSPNWSAVHIQHFWGHHTDLKRAGLLVVVFAAALTGPFAAAISTQMKRIEGTYSPLTYSQLGLGMLGVLVFWAPMFAMQAAAFRSHRDPQITQALNDLAWLPFVGTWALALLQNIAIALAVFKDTEERVFPRWLGWFNIWVGITFLGSSLLYYFKSGPFAWNGLFPFWIPLVAYTAWFFVLTPMLLRAIRQQEGELDEVAPADLVAVGV